MVVLQSRKQFGELQRSTAGGIGSDGVGRLLTKNKTSFWWWLFGQVTVTIARL